MDLAKFSKEFAFWFGSVLIAIMALIIFLMIPLENQSKGPETLKKIYFVDNISIAHQTLIDKFNKLHEGEIEVIPVNLPFSKFSTNERKEILARSLRSKSERIDIFSIDVIWGPRFARWSYPLDNYVTQDELKNLNRYALETCYYKNRLIALPLYIDIGLLYYRKDILSKFPDHQAIEEKLRHSITWEEFIALGKRWKWKNPFYIFAGDSFEGLVCSFHEMLTQKQIRSIFDSPRINLSTAATERGMHLLVDMMNRYRFTPKVVAHFDEYKCYQYAIDNDALFLRGWTGLHQQFSQIKTFQDKLNNIDIAPLPRFKENEKSAVFGGWNMMVSKYSKNKKEAIDFIKFVQETENQEQLFRFGGYIPVNKAVYKDSLFLAQNSRLGEYLHLLDFGKHRPMREDYTMISDIVSHYMNSALKKEISVEDALKEASQKINTSQVFLK